MLWEGLTSFSCVVFILFFPSTLRLCFFFLCCHPHKLPREKRGRVRKGEEGEREKAKRKEEREKRGRGRRRERKGEEEGGERENGKRKGEREKRVKWPV